MSDIDKTVREMKSLGNILADHSFPVVTADDEDQIAVLKNREVVVDGYVVVLHYGKSILDGVVLENFQCLGQRSPFLPFHLVARLGVKFLGDRHLGFVDVFSHNKKVYCWTRFSDPDGNPVPAQQPVLREIDFEGLKFSYLDPKGVTFF